MKTTAEGCVFFFRFIEGGQKKDDKGHIIRQIQTLELAVAPFQIPAQSAVDILVAGLFCIT